MNIEQLKFEAKEYALKLEIQKNPKSCLTCRAWQYGGEMSVSIMKCDECGERNAFSFIKSVINKYSDLLEISYEESWDLAYKCLKEQQKKAVDSGRIVYFDEDYFLEDLTKFYEKLLNLNKKPIKLSLFNKVLNLILNDRY